MTVRVFFKLLIVFLFITAPARAQQSFDKSAFYTILESGKVADIDAQITMVKKLVLPEKEAYEGVLLMKKSGMMAKPKDKLSVFKMGRLKLEAAITSDNNNIEYRFLRLIIQEHAPKIVKYQNALNEDSKLIRNNFKNLSPFLKETITDYSKKSKVLKTL
jgi:hypothetical protein